MMRAHYSQLDDTLLSAERRVRAIKLRLEALVADQLSLPSSATASSATASSATASSDAASSSSNVSLRRRARSRSPLRPRRLHLESNQYQLQSQCVTSLSTAQQSQSTTSVSQSQPQSSHSPTLGTSHPLAQSPNLHMQKTQPNCLTPHNHVTSNTHASFSPLTPQPVPPPPAPPLPPPPLPPASNTRVPNISSQSFLPPQPPSLPIVQPIPKESTRLSSAVPSRSHPPPPPPPPPPPRNLVQRVSSNRRAPPPPPSAILVTATEIVEEQDPSPSSPQSRIEKKLDALHVALSTALSLLQSQPAAAAISSDAPLDTTRPLKKQPPPEHAVKVFDARQQMLEELKKKIGKRQKAAEEGAIANY